MTDGMVHTFDTVSLHPFVDYQFAIKACTTHTCLDHVFSERFRVEKEPPTGAVNFAEVKSDHVKTCFDFAMTWEDFETDSDVLFYQWTISKDRLASNIIIPWGTVDSRVYQIKQCIEMQSHVYAKLFGCVRAFSLAGSQSVDCEVITVVRSGEYKMGQNIVYDLDHKSEIWQSLLDVVHSFDLGNGYTFLHDNEIDIATKDVGMAGAILGAVDRNVTWYLMTSRHIPRNCDDDEECYFETEADVGYAVIPDRFIKINTLYFICAYSNESFQTLHTVNEISSCSNGFMIDDEPPSPTSEVVQVTNVNGFITDIDRLTIRWDAFSDNVNASVFGYPDNIRSYSYGLGHRPGSDDIKSFKTTRHAKVGVARDLNVEDGTPLYAVVQAFDYVGLTSIIISKELIVDTSPPEIGWLVLEPDMTALETVNYISSDTIVLHMVNFQDRESGISYFEVGIGTSRYFNNILPLKKYYQNVATLELDDNMFEDGLVYFINYRVTNYADLATHFTSVTIIVDQSAPTGGHVIDGQLTEETAEIDYSLDLYRVHAHWKGFADPHSPIHYYRCGFGTKQYTDNIRNFRHVGLKQDIEWTGPFVAGQTYYTTVEACNHAGLCYLRSSNGILLDNTPPVGGLVFLGSDEFHHKFFPYRHWLHIHWVKFEDPHSGIDHFDVCIGTTTGECNIVDGFENVLENNIIITELDLPLNKDLFVLVTAYNHVGLNVSRVSDSFRIDTTPPVLELEPLFVDPMSPKEEISVHWEKSILRISWLFTDPESPIINHEISLHTHHEGHIPKQHVHLGATNNLTINLSEKEWLHNGDIYYVKVTSCNAAGLCSTARSRDLRIDSTPPHLGGFKKPLEWRNYNKSQHTTLTNLTLTWYGFYDQESPITFFYITASRTYSGQELTKGVFTLKVEKQNGEYTADISLIDYIKQDDILVLTIWAENQAGLISSVARVSVFVLSEISIVDEHLKYGLLEIEKHSCDIHYCNKDCTCAVLDQPCIYVDSNSTCTELESSSDIGSPFPTVTVRFGYVNKEQKISSSSACLTGFWKITNATEVTVERFEWSMGLSDQPVGEGIYHLKTEQPWNDIGKRQQITYCLPVNRSLIQREAYILYVRAWYDRDTYATFQSSPIMIDHSPPAVRRGRYIKDSDSMCSKDFDIIDWTDSVTGCWSGVFSELQGQITHYQVTFGTYRQADDIFTRTNVGLDTNITLTNMNLTHGTRYYFTVTAYNTAGLSTSLSSDGFQVDTDDPVAGVVFNHLNWRNREFQSSDSILGISWSGFSDHFSGIRQYHIAISETDDNATALTFKPIVLKTSYTFYGLRLGHNKTYYGAVKASDAVGHFSDVVFSPGITIDNTPPFGFTCKTFELVDDYVFNQTGDGDDKISINMTKGELFRLTFYVHDADYHTKVFIDTGTEKTYLYPLRIHDNSSHQYQYSLLAEETKTRVIIFSVLSKGNPLVEIAISQCRNIVVDDNNAVSVTQTGMRTLRIDKRIADEESGIFSIKIGVGTTYGGFQIQALKEYNHLSSHVVVNTNTDHRSRIYVTAIAENCAGLTSVFKANPITMDHTPPIIEEVHTLANVQSEHVNSSSGIFIIIDATWNVNDDESGVKYCFCALESVLGARDVKSFWEADSLTNCSSGRLQIKQISNVHLVIKCVNNIEMDTVYTTEPYPITYAPPNTEHEKIYILPSDTDNIMVSSESRTYVQTNRSVVKFGWTKFKDDADIASYDYRLSLQDSPIVDWRSISSRDVVSLYGLNLNTGGIYRAEVKAVNVNGMVSDVISASVMVLEERPRFTGKAVSVSVHGNQMLVDWSSVFISPPEVDLKYYLVIGTKEGYSDVIDVGPLKTSARTVTVPSSTLITPSPTELFIRISCWYPFGIVQMYAKTYKL